MLARTPLTDRERVAAIAAAIVCVAVVGVSLSLSIPLLSIEMERMGASSTMAGLNAAVAGFASIVTLPFVPRLARRIGVLPLLLASIALGALSLIGFRAFYDLTWWFPLRFLLSTALGALFVLSEYWISIAAPAHRRGLVMGIYATVLALGFALGPALLLVFGTEGWPPYIAGAVLILAAAIPVSLAHGLSPKIERGGATGFFGFVRLVPAATLAALLYGAVETGGFSILPLYGLRLGLDAQGAAGLVSVVALGNVLFQVPIGLLADRVDRRWLLVAVAVCGGLASLAMPAAAGSIPALMALLFVWGGVAGTLYTVGLAELGASVRAPDLAGANAAFVLLYSLGMIVGPPAVGGGLDLVPPHGFAWALAALFGTYAITVLPTLLKSAERPSAVIR